MKMMNLEEHEEEEIEETSWRCWLRTFGAGSGALIISIFVGICEAQSSVMLPQLKKADSPIQITPDEGTWIASLGIIMAPLSSIIIGPSLDAFGRKKGLQLFYLITGMGYGVLSCAREVYHIYIGRCICGFGAGLYVCSMVYLIEICTVKQRDYIVTITPGLLSGGVFLGTVVCGILPWQTASLIFSLSSFALLVFQFFIPESPPWLLRKGETDECICILRTLGRSESAIRQELKASKLSFEEYLEKVQLRTFLEPTVYKPFVITVIFFFLQSATGIWNLIYYAVDFVERLGTTYDPLSVAMMSSFARFLGSCTIVYFSSRASRRFLTALSSYLMMAALLVAGIYEYGERDVSISTRPLQWIPIASILLCVVASTIGLLDLPYGMSSELYPLRVRGTMTGVSFFVGDGFIFISVKTYDACINALRIDGLLIASAGFCFIALIFGIFVLPETQNKSLLEIEQGFLPKKKRPLKTRETPTIISYGSV